MSVSAAERDIKREQAFALAMQKVPYREIARRLDINKSTVVEYVRQERQRRSHDRDAEDAIRDGVAVLRSTLQDLFDQLLQTTGTGPMTGIAKAKLAESIRRTARELVLVYGVKLPKIDGQEIAMDRLLEMVQQEIDAPPIGFPEVGEEAAYDAYVADLDEQLEAAQSEHRRMKQEYQETRREDRFTSWEEVLDSASEYDDGY